MRDLILQRYVDHVAAHGSQPSIRELGHAVPCSKAAIYHYFDSLDGVRRAVERNLWDTWMLEADTSPDPIPHLQQLVIDEVGATLLLDYDAAHHLPTGVPQRLLPDLPHDTAHAATHALLGALSSLRRSHSHLLADLTVTQLDRMLRLCVTAVERTGTAPAFPRLGIDHAEIERTAAEQLEDGLRKRLVLAGMRVVRTGDQLTARRLARTAQTSLSTIYNLGGLDSVYLDIDLAIRTCVERHDDPVVDAVDAGYRIVAFGQKVPRWFAFMAKAQVVDGPGQFDTLMLRSVSDARLQGRLRDDSLPDELLLALAVGPVVRRFRNRDEEPAAWDAALLWIDALIDTLFVDLSREAAELPKCGHSTTA